MKKQHAYQVLQQSGKAVISTHKTVRTHRRRQHKHISDQEQRWERVRGVRVRATMRARACSHVSVRARVRVYNGVGAGLWGDDAHGRVIKIGRGHACHHVGDARAVLPHCHCRKRGGEGGGEEGKGERRMFWRAR